MGDGVDFSILGPLEARHHGNAVPIPGRHAPKLLAVLLLEHGRFVGLPRLVDAIWADNPPATAKRQIQNVIATMRRALPDPEVIESNATGYRLHPQRSTVDHHEFQRLRSLARSAPAADALRHLREALRLWRGAPLEGLPGSVVESAAAKLDEERLSALEDRIELELEIDPAVDATSELRQLIDANPFRQRLAGLLMRALNQSGQRIEALEVYERLRERLAEELGLDPDPELVRRYTAIVAGAPEPRRSEASAGSRPVPAQLPAAPSTFTGRREHIAELDRLLEHGDGAAVVSAIAGMGGAGKTALALHWGHRVRDRFPDGQLYINLRGYDEAEPVAPIDALGRFLVALGHTNANVPSDVDAAARLFRSLVAGRRMLVILDNARTAEQVRPLLPGGAENVALVTSRNRLASLTTVDRARPMRLDTLSREESLELLGTIVGRDRLRSSSIAAQRIAESCGDLPLALRIAAANLAAQPETAHDDFASLLAGPARLAQLAISGDPHAAVTHTVGLSVRALDGNSRELLFKLGLVPGEDFSRPLAIHLSQLPEVTAVQCLSRLEEAHLLETHRPDRYRLHDLVRAYAVDCASIAFDGNMTHDFQTAFIQWHYAMRRTMRATEARNVVTAFNAWNRHPEVWRLTTAFLEYSSAEYTPGYLKELCVRLLSAPHLEIDTLGHCNIYFQIAMLDRALGYRRSAITWAEKAVRLAGTTNAADEYGRFLANLAILHLDIGQMSKAEPYLREALVAANSHADSITAFASASTLAAVCRRLGKLEESKAIFDDLLGDVDHGIPSYYVATAYAQFATLCLDIGQATEALRIFDRLLADGEWEIGHRSALVSRITRSNALRVLGRFEEARSELSRVIDSATRADLFGLIDTARTRMAEVISDSGDHESALALLSDRSIRELGEPDLEQKADLARIQCVVHTRLGAYREAIVFGAAACRDYVAMPDVLMHARTLTALALAHDGDGDTAQARACRRKALDIFTRLGVPEAEELRTLLDASG